MYQLGALVLSASCGGGGYDEIRTQVFTPSCAQQSCHGESGSGGLFLDDKAYENLVGQPPYDEEALADGLKRVAPFDPAKSLLLIKLTPPVDPRYGVLMPKGRTDAEPLEEDKREMIKAWIEAGAPKE
ncbi:MAG: hypothetical protein HYV07_15415 [Deltaproteobacteria bacterium]|nr:hypothetical protein [Deltaproteobacteria bacterium]